jgi:hypothetical protein
MPACPIQNNGAVHCPNSVHRPPAVATFMKILDDLIGF